MALTPTQLDAALNGAVVEYDTIQAPIARVRARFVRHGSDGVWISQVEGGKRGEEPMSTARARMALAARDMRLVREAA